MNTGPDWDRWDLNSHLQLIRKQSFVSETKGESKRNLVEVAPTCECLRVVDWEKKQHERWMFITSPQVWISPGTPSPGCLIKWCCDAFHWISDVYLKATRFIHLENDAIFLGPCAYQSGTFIALQAVMGRGAVTRTCLRSCFRYTSRFFFFWCKNRNQIIFASMICKSRNRFDDVLIYLSPAVYGVGRPIEGLSNSSRSTISQYLQSDLLWVTISVI